ncbi:MAG TPA: tetratricopeptide repeat protein [Terriglobia bacterium]|nr:tetratricopeptide repeat protein [Terriglobia bacterium]
MMAALAGIAVLPYLNSLSNGFVYDDVSQVLNNPYLRSFHYLRQIFTSSVWSFQGGYAGVTNYYRPMMSFGYLVCYRLFGPNAFVFHAVNVILNAAVVLVLYDVTRRLFRSEFVAVAAALVFALHPVHSESVDWVGAVTDLELTLFFLAAFGFYLRIPRLTSGRPSGRWFVVQTGVVLSLALAALSKEPALTLPVLLVIYEHFYREDRAETSVFEKIARYAPAWAFVPIYLVARAHFLGGFAPVQVGRPGAATDELAISAVALLGQYAAKMLWPVRLCAYYVFPTSWLVLLPEVLGGIAAVVIGSLLFILLWKWARLASFGLVWFLVTLAPALDIRWMPVGAFAERYLYLPSVGLCWVIAWACWRLWGIGAPFGRTWRVGLAVVAVALMVPAALRIVTRNRDWKDDLTFYQRTLALSPDSNVMHTNLGKLYWEQGKTDLAEQQWRAAAELAPDAPVVLDNMGLLLTSRQQYDEALADLTRAVQIAPEDSFAHRNLANLYSDLGRREEAEQEFKAALSISPLDFRTRDELGQLYLDEGRFPEAEVQFRASLALRPSLAAWLGLGISRWRQGDSEAAELDLKNAEAMDAADGRIHVALGLLYDATGRKAQALDEYQASLKTDIKDPQTKAAFQKLQSEMSDANSSGRGAP